MPVHSTNTQRVVDLLEHLGKSVIKDGKLPADLDVNLATLLTTDVYNGFVAEMEAAMSDPDKNVQQEDRTDYDMVLVGLQALSEQYFAGRTLKR